MNMYERYAMSDVLIGRDKGMPRAIVVERVTSWSKDLASDKVSHSTYTYGRPQYLSEFIRENVRPNRIYSSRLMQNAVKLMEQAGWDKSVFSKLWDIAYANGITTRDEVLNMIREVSAQMYNERGQEENKLKVQKDLLDSIDLSL